MTSFHVDHRLIERNGSQYFLAKHFCPEVEYVVSSDIQHSDSKMYTSSPYKTHRMSYWDFDESPAIKQL
jgi:hypothetical protein